jgi:putative peptidoglycan lipid II flippase
VRPGGRVTAEEGAAAIGERPGDGNGGDPTPDAAERAALLAGENLRATAEMVSDPGPSGSAELGDGGEMAEMTEAAAVSTARVTPGRTVRDRAFARNSSVLLATSLLARTLGFFRDTVIADKFGATGLTDAYFVANTLPTFLNGVLQGALGSVVVPTVAEEFAAGRSARAYGTLSGLTVYLGAATLLFCTLVTVLAPQIVAGLAPGLHHAPTAVRLARILVWTVAFSAFAYLGAAASMAQERFAYMSLGPIFMSGSATLVLVVFRHPPIDYLALGLLGGNILQFGFQLWPHVNRRTLPALRRPAVADPAVRRMLHVAWPSLISSSVGQINVLVDRMFGSFLRMGSITEVTYADRLIQVPLALFGTAVANASYPEMARAYSAGETGVLREVILRDLRAILLFTVPVTGLLFGLAYNIVWAVFKHGAMSAGEADVVVAALNAYTGCLIPYSVRTVLNRGFFVTGRTRQLASLSVWMVLLNAAGDALLSRLIGAPGLALGTTIDQWISIVASFMLLRRFLPFLPIRDTVDAFARLLVATLPLAAAAWATAHGLDALRPFFRVGLIGKMVTVVVAAGVGMAVGYAALRLVRYPDLDLFMGRFGALLPRRRR